MISLARSAEQLLRAEGEFRPGTSRAPLRALAALVIVGGLISSTLLDMTVTPAVFYLFGEKASEKWMKQGLFANTVLSLSVPTALAESTTFLPRAW